MSSAPPGAGIPAFPSGLITYFAIVLVYTLIMAVVLAVSGIGLLNMKKWARNTCIAYSIITITHSILSPIIYVTYVGPSMQNWQKDLQEEVTRQQQRQGVRPPPMYQPSQSPWFNAMSSIGGAIVGMAYAVALLVVMFLPHVSAAFAGRRIRRRIDWNREPDDDWER
jgi:hypothetical protein